jgi:hypothetical protein
VSGTDRWEVERWECLPLDLDLDFDADEEPVVDRRRVYPPLWRRAWPVHREASWDPHIPVLRDIAEYKRTA